MERTFDLAVVGAGIVGLAHALAAARLGKRVVVVDRDAQANGASVRNFGFVTVTGQARGEVWRRARRSARVWDEIAGPAGIEVVQRGLTMVARRPEARAVLEAFLETEMAEGCAWRDAVDLGDRLPGQGEVLGALTSSVDLRVESRTAIPRLAAWLEAAHGVTFLRGVAVQGVETGRLETSAGAVSAETVVVCPGDDLITLFPDAFAQAEVTRCKLQMLRLAAPGWRLPGPVMSDLGLVRYLGYAALPEAAALRVRLEAEQPAHLEHGVHLIVAQSADGSLVVGDSHHYAATPDPFARDDVDALILDEFAKVFGQAPPPVLERWTGTYASAAGHSLVEAPMPRVRLVTVTSGTGASTAFGLAEDVIAGLYDLPRQGAAA
ncbi:TIGR03364 family FAD-dependent oxidoreductase [Caulobacter sp. FWC2]|uniref:TIGR03364 family FAD-dependent oxidoreductase n=1 Tax=Caulobacter sp. FWC2 TaxID=69664 RepID=UPI000C157A4F|nr:TIGR03364 family FAD-dependent oxidoreductase [Caulobacter sp. FWC2]PIB91854.1 TIGR03364 family FAD-dependent oxidoreductase [Caulobacter sp. FWC2]